MQKNSMLCLLILIATMLIAIVQSSASNAIIGFTRFFALEGFMLLCVALLIGPLSLFFPKIAHLIEPRRTVGISAFVFIAAHVYMVISQYFSFDLTMIFTETTFIIGLIAFLITLIITITSCDYALKHLKQKKWKAIQRLAYIVFILVLVHFIVRSMLLKTGQADIAEIAITLLAIITIIMQFAGFIKKRKISKKLAFSQMHTTKQVTEQKQN